MLWTMTLSANGQITLPKAARDCLGAVGDKIVLVERRGRSRPTVATSCAGTAPSRSTSPRTGQRCGATREWPEATR